MTALYIVAGYGGVIVVGVIAYVVAALHWPGSELTVATVAGTVGGIAMLFASAALIAWRTK